MTKHKQLSQTQQRFVEAFIRYNNASKAVRLAYGDDADKWSRQYIGLKGHRMINNDNIKQAIDDRKAIMQANANLAASRIQVIIRDGKEHNALQASIFALEQADGKAKQVTEVHTNHVTVTYDLSGGAAGAIPDEILRQLEG